MASSLYGTQYANVVTRAATFPSNPCFTNVNLNSITTGRPGTLGALLRPENYLLVLFAISTTLWTVAFLFYFLSTQIVASVGAFARAAHLRSAGMKRISR
jgi:hypothetical protein